ncbi:hypothetical protein LSH36_1043g00011, partial [Paralvinella palmiformis]
MSHLTVVQPQRPHRELRHQRSYSTGDLSPTLEKWERESVVDGTHRKDTGKTKKTQSTESPHDSAKKPVSDRRKGWIKQKQKSKSFDFSWRVGGMWSPVEDRKGSRREIILLQSEPRHPRPKPPSMLELDSGSSYESRDISFYKHPDTTMMPSLLSSEELSLRVPQRSHHQRDQQRVDGPSKSSRDDSQEDRTRDGNKSRGGGASRSGQKSPTSPERRRSVFTERKSHSLDSSIEDYHSSSQERDGELQPAAETQQYTTMTAKDRRLKLQEQRRSRSLDTYEPRHIEFRPVAPPIRSSSGSREKILDSGHQPRRKTSKNTSAKDELSESVAKSRRPSDIVACQTGRKQSDVINSQLPRRASDFVTTTSGGQRWPADGAHKGSSRRPSDLGSRTVNKKATESSPATRRRSEIGRGCASPRRSSEVDPATGRGSPSLRKSGDRSGSGSPSRRQIESSGREYPDSSRRGEAKKAFMQQKSFSFEVTGHHPKAESTMRDRHLKSMPESVAVRSRVKGRMLPRIPDDTLNGQRPARSTSPRRR